MYLAYIIFFEAAFRNVENKKIMNTIMFNLNIGDSKETVTSILDTHNKTSNLSLDKTGLEQWIIRMPMEFGARSWRLLIDFEGNKITQLRIRTDDNDIIKPKGALDDKKFIGRRSKPESTPFNCPSTLGLSWSDHAVCQQKTFQHLPV